MRVHSTAGGQGHLGDEGEHVIDGELGDAHDEGFAARLQRPLQLLLAIHLLTNLRCIKTVCWLHKLTCNASVLALSSLTAWRHADILHKIVLDTQTSAAAGRSNSNDACQAQKIACLDPGTNSLEGWSRKRHWARINDLGLQDAGTAAGDELQDGVVGAQAEQRARPPSYASQVVPQVAAPVRDHVILVVLDRVQCQLHLCMTRVAAT